MKSKIIKASLKYLMCLTAAILLTVFSPAASFICLADGKTVESSDTEESTATVLLSGAEDDEPDSNEGAFSVPGNGEVLDEIRSSSDKEFYTIQTANNTTYYLVIDHSGNTDNVYMLSLIDENDLAEFLDKEVKEEEPVIIEEPEPVITEPEPVKQEEKKEGGSLGFWLIAFIVGAGAVAAYFYFRIYKPRVEEDDSESENMEYDTSLETESEDAEDSE
jgi:hypothetical protein